MSVLSEMVSEICACVFCGRSDELVLEAEFLLPVEEQQPHDDGSGEDSCTVVCRLCHCTGPLVLGPEGRPPTEDEQRLMMGTALERWNTRRSTP